MPRNFQNKQRYNSDVVEEKKTVSYSKTTLGSAKHSYRIIVHENTRLLILNLLRIINRDEETALNSPGAVRYQPEPLNEYLPPCILYKYTRLFCTGAVYVYLTFEGLAEKTYHTIFQQC